MRHPLTRVAGKLPIVIAIILTAFSLFLNENDGRAWSWGGRQGVDFKTWEAPFSMSEVRQFHPKASRYEKDRDGSYLVWDAENKPLGYVVNTTPSANAVFGYAGRVPLLVALDRNRRIIGMTLLEHAETPGAVVLLRKGRFLERWNGTAFSDVGRRQVDSVSGATITSRAIVQALNLRSDALSRRTSVDTADWGQIVRNGVAFGLLGLALIQFLAPARWARFRPIYLSISVLVFGFWLGHSLSLHLLYQWIVRGVPLHVHLFLFVLFSLSVLLPLFTHKPFYCRYVCPFGCSQELLGRILGRTGTLSAIHRLKLHKVRPLVLMAIVFLFLIGHTFNLVWVEPFAFFQFRAAPIIVLSLALVVLGLSILLPRPWCHYVCPTGQLLDLFCKRPRHSRGGSHETEL